MLPKKYRLKGTKIFKELKARSIKSHSKDLLVLKAKQNSDQSYSPRIGFIISKKVSKRAVNRNKIKRILSNILRKKLEKLDTNYDYVVIVKKSAMNASASDLEGQLIKLIK